MVRLVGGQTERMAARDKNKPTDRQTDRQTDRKTNRQTDIETPQSKIVI